MSNPDLALAESVSTTNASYFIIVYIVILIYCCFGLAVVCDVYFVPALQKLSKTYDLPPDIAGSTLMALGASVPELFASLIGVFVTEDDIGTGSIIGSSCFNLIAVPAACAFVASAAFTKKLSISPMPVIRNSAFYAITILVLLLIIKDNKVDILEASILLIFFVLYMGLMIYSAHNTKKQHHHDHQQSVSGHSLSSSFDSSCADSAIAGCTDHSRRNSSGSSPASHDQNKTASAVIDLNNNSHNINTNKSNKNSSSNNNNNNSNQVLGSYGQFYFAVKPSETASKADERTPLVASPNYHQQQQHQYHSDDSYSTNQHQQRPICDTGKVSASDECFIKVDLGSVAIKNSACLASSLRFDRAKYNNSYDDDSISVLKRQQNGAGGSDLDQQDEFEENWVSSKWILMPMLPLTLSMRILTPCKFKNTFWTIWTFLISVALIGALTYVSVCMVSMFGQVIGIPETVAGMTILSWGTGIPELIASIVLIKKTAKADMAICNTIGSNVIDVSFCLSLPWIVKCLMSKAEGHKPEVEIQSAALPWTCFTLLLSVVLLLLILKLHDWVLGFSVGCWLMVVYGAFVGLATYLESTFAEDGLDLLALF